jgi:hypothetical protein
MILWQTVDVAELSTAEWATEWKHNFLRASLAFHRVWRLFRVNAKGILYFYAKFSKKEHAQSVLQ